MDSDLWSLRNKRSMLNIVERLINGEGYIYNIELSVGFQTWLWKERALLLKEILEIQIRNYRR